MNDIHIEKISGELDLTPEQVQATARLLAEDATVPFIARYRKEATGSLDEVAVTAIRDRLRQLKELDQKRESVLKSLEQHGHLTDELKEKVEAAETMAALMDVYLPYKPKRRTRAVIAKEKGLEPLAQVIFGQTGQDVHAAAAGFVDPEKGVESVEDALAGARDIIAEMINEHEKARAEIRALFISRGVIRSGVAAGKEAEGAKFRNYFEWEEPVKSAPSHRVLAMRRGEKEDILNLSMLPPEDEAVAMLKGMFITGDGEDARQVEAALTDGYKRLLSRSMETEIRLMTKQNADAEAIRVFAENLRRLLMAPPLGAKRVLGIDPGFRTGCKMVCLDRQGKLLHSDTIYLHRPEQAVEKVTKLCADYDIEAVAAGNGTASRETEALLKEMKLHERIPVVMVNESGASVYSASEAAREEFPDLDLTVRGAVSIGRRLMDPLSELVKIDPKSIGVGQYQHDVDQTQLKQALDDVVISCVNAVGVDVNRASKQLLTYVSGLGPQLAANIVAHRDENGPFATRKALKKVPRLGPKAFEQCAGFLRIPDGADPLDASAVHPESYAVVDAMAKDLNCAVADLMKTPALRDKIDISRYTSDTVGLPTLRDILDELAKQGRDPRQAFETFSFASGVEKITDLVAGVKLPGIVTNVTAFGAFVDVGVHQDGLVHISEMADRFVKDPAEIVSVGQKVTVTVLSVDIDRNRISLSMKPSPGKGERKSKGKRPPDRPSGKKPKGKPADRPFHNPFSDILGKR